VLFGVFWIIELIFRWFIVHLLAAVLGLPQMLEERNRIKFGRCLMSTVVMAWCSMAGIETYYNHGGWASLTQNLHPSDFSGGGNSTMAGSARNAGLEESALAAARVYVYFPGAARLCVFHLAWESKNLIDAILHRDGLLLPCHHIMTGVLAFFGLHPYLQMYAAFFFGMSEISSSILTLLVLFDDQHGIHGVGDAMPIVKKLLGAAFTVSFVLVRIVMWPIVSHRFALDSLAVWADEKRCHSYAAVSIFLVCNASLTVMQFIWLRDIVVTARKEFFPSATEQEETKKLQ